MNQEMFEWSLRFESHKQVDVTGTRETKSVERRPKKKKKVKKEWFLNAQSP